MELLSDLHGYVSLHIEPDHKYNQSGRTNSDCRFNFLNAYSRNDGCLVASEEIEHDHAKLIKDVFDFNDAVNAYVRTS